MTRVLFNSNCDLYHIVTQYFNCGYFAFHKCFALHAFHNNIGPSGVHAIQIVNSKRPCSSQSVHRDDQICLAIRCSAFTWTVPWLAVLASTVLLIITAVLYVVPFRYLVLAWAINKFTKKLRDPNYIDNNEILDYLSRVPSDKETVSNSNFLYSIRLIFIFLRAYH